MEQTIQEIFENFLVAMNVEFRHTEVVAVEDDEEGEGYYCNVSAKDNSQLIGKQGKTLQAVQHLLKLIVYKRIDRMVGITVDIDGYRQRQRDSVSEIAKRYIEKVRETGKPEALPPMSPYFRRVVHMMLLDPEFQDLKSSSEGHGNFRHVVISQK